LKGSDGGIQHQGQISSTYISAGNVIGVVVGVCISIYIGYVLVMIWKCRQVDAPWSAIRIVLFSWKTSLRYLHRAANAYVSLTDEKLKNTVLAELQVSLSKQEELVKLNRQVTLEISELKKVMSEGNASVVEQLKKTGNEMTTSAKDLGVEMKEAMASQSKASSSSIRVNLSSIESSIMKSIGAIDKRIASDKALKNVAASQKKTKAEVQSLNKQAKEIKKLLETQQNRITFP
jgi:hypothetical protein